MTETREAEFWTMDEDAELLTCEDFDEAIEQGLGTDHKHWDDTVTVHGFARRAVTPEWQTALAESIARHALEYLDDEFGGGDDPLNDIDDVRQAAEKFAADVVSEYEVWQCERVCSETVCLAAWIQRESPHWMEENPDIQAWVEARLPKEAGK